MIFICAAAAENVAEGRLALDVPVKLGKTVIPAHAEAHVHRPRRWLAAARGGGAACRRASTGSISAPRFATARITAPVGRRPPGELDLGFIGSGHIGDVRLRGSADFDIDAGGRFRDAELSAYWSATEHGDWEGDVAYDGD